MNSSIFPLRLQLVLPLLLIALLMCLVLTQQASPQKEATPLDRTPREKTRAEISSTSGLASSTGLIRSRRSGNWSEAGTWENGSIPDKGSRVQIQAGHRVVYDVNSAQVIRSIHVAGTLTFSRKGDTRLDVGLIKIQAGQDASEHGFHCDTPPSAPAAGSVRPALEVGTAAAPIPAGVTARIRLTYLAGMDKESCPAIVCCGGRMDLHGAPLARTWVELSQLARAGEAKLVLPAPLPGWKVGDRIVIVGTTRQVGYLGTRKMPTVDSIKGKHSSEERIITDMKRWGGSGFGPHTQWQIVSLDAPLRFEHRATEAYQTEVANLSRNVIIESADPAGVRGHTMYHRHSQGSISYVEFRHLGKEGVLGKYPIHYHLCGDTMRGSSVLGASIWDSGNRWVTIHGTQYLVVRDCVGFGSIGHGFFLEDGTEVFNVLDRNLAILACRGKPLPEQMLPYDQNLGSGFWWANNLNTFTRNVAAECDEDGFRFEVVKTAAFDPRLAILQPDGRRAVVDVRTVPFVRFEGNEAHTHRLFAINLGGFSATEVNKPESDVGGVGPDGKHPLLLRHLQVWDAHWGFHTGCPRIIIEEAEFHDCLYGMWRCVLDGHEHKRVRYLETLNPLFFPRHASSTVMDDVRPYPEDHPVDDLPPLTIITHIERLSAGRLRLRGTASDNYEIAQVTVNGQMARALEPNFAEWEVELPIQNSTAVKLAAHSTDAAGNVEQRPHVLAMPLPD